METQNNQQKLQNQKQKQNLTIDFITNFIQTTKKDEKYFQENQTVQDFIDAEFVRMDSPYKIEWYHIYLKKLEQKKQGILPEKKPKKKGKKNKKYPNKKHSKDLDEDGETNSEEFKIQKQKENEEIKQKKEEIKNKQNLFYEEMVKKNQENEKKVLSKLRFSLNILSPDNFQKIKGDILENLDKFQCQNSYVEFYDLLIKKALSDSKYGHTFSQLFNALFEKKSEHKKQILLQLNELFDGEKEIHATKKEYKDMDGFEKFNYEKQKKQKYLALANFLGIMFENNAIPQKIIQICMIQSLNNFLKQYFAEKTQKNESDSDGQEVEEQKKQNQDNSYSYPCEVYLEVLLNIIEKVGRKFDERHSKKSKSSLYNDQIREENLFIKKLKETIQEFQKSENVKSDAKSDDKKILQSKDIEFGDKLSIQGIFNILELIIVQQKLVDVRLESLIANLQERRGQNWQERMLVKDNTAKTKQQVFQEEKERKEKMQQKQQQQQFYQNQDYDEDDLDDMEFSKED